jgi:hypothetical protein
MQFMKIMLIGLVAGSTIWATAATALKRGVTPAAYPRGVSLRQDSLQGVHSPLIPGRKTGRVHRGGGLSAGK